MKNRRLACGATVVAALALAAPARGDAAGLRGDHAPVRVVLQITIDQLRADLLLRDRRLWGDDGFRRLFDDGAVFVEAHHAHANTETAVGHATLATGADPSVHGIVGNQWFERATGALQHNVEDPHFAMVGHSAAPGSPATAESPCGRSPYALLAPTIADSVALAGGGRAKVFSVSLKDRAAVPMAGRGGKALWWSDRSGEFLSSTYYYPDGRLPAWAMRWNDGHDADRLDGRAWTLLLDAKNYAEAGADDEPWEQPPAGMGVTFPHRYDRSALGDGFYAAVATSPFGDDLLLAFTRALIAAEGIGRDDVTDYLSVSFSASDYIGHRYGPASLEVEDEILRLDREVAALLRAVDDAAGPGRTIVVLSSDHGVGAIPEALAAEGRDSGRVEVTRVEEGPAVARLAERFGGKFVLGQASPYVYLDNTRLRAHHVDPATAARQLAAEFAKTPGIEAAFTRAQIESRATAPNEVLLAVKRNFCPSRSGDIHLIAKPGWQLVFDGGNALPYAAGHGSPWSFDTHVPLVFAGPGVAQATVSRRVETIDVAPTLARLAGVAAPLRASGRVLGEALR